MKKFLFVFLFWTLVCGGTLSAQNRWSINPDGSISWNVKDRIPHYDHIEMSGLKVSTVLRYGVNADGSFELNKSMVWPMLRTIPNNTHASLMRRFAWNATDMVSVNGQSLSGEKVNKITLDGKMTVESTIGLPRNAEAELTRIIFPAVAKPAVYEKYILRNTGSSPLTVEVPESRAVINTDPEKGVDGSYKLVSEIIGAATKQLQPKEELVFYAAITGYKNGEAELKPDVEKELQERKELIAGFWNNLILETPDPVVNTMFAFAKIRGAESIYDTKGGLMHGPGGESYYAAIWANDQAEYINPFFPYLGYGAGNGSALNSFKHFARFMNPEYEKIPSSIIAEGIDVWGGAGDRGDAAMVAYGASRYALARGGKAEAEELWPLIEWCLEYCHRNLNDKGVVASDSDELEGRFPAGKANLCTSSLYYDALRSAVYLGKDLKKPFSVLSAYEKQARDLRENMENYFGAKVEGFDTYQYYEGNDVLRSWICIPLTVGIFDRKEGTINALFSPRLWTENGLLTQAGSETFWDRSTLYALRGVYACGATAKATEYLKFYSNQRLLGDHVPYAIEAWPEGSQRHLSAESGLYGRIITEGMFGIRPTGLKSFTFTPRLPSEWNSMNLRKIKAFNTTFDIEVLRENGKQLVTVKSEGKTLLHKAIKEGEIVSVKLD
ncbi:MULTISPECIES: hypothetical protein [Parabacteroides]|uniref:Six-hairpin glycosidase-like protein n=3 Tax=Parabacteroides goldsteinii TaxID=328812 RepID=A0A6G1Z7Z4_9BACT|nr:MULTISPECIES: hypothetical protein [Parabacteroides]EOS15907.1 hypothetical protein C803_04220 [Parabacteroides goldsteinii dnLKV18]KAI4363391.1 hypothetical protein C825_005510 [Parabacteroides sp. ASF519]MBF0765890.1 hypothetical protein [Parabacteroides goldsteinii]MDZ3926062.1 hypothetical protein [Parabacteroides goldsteinii]MRX90418.1 hypothetical protein [Parabacteroides goldsteinii]